MKYLPASVSLKLHYYLVITLDQSLSSSLHAYEDKLGIFKTLFDNNYSDPIIFWREAGRTHPDFNRVSLRYISIPAFSNCWFKDESNDVDNTKDLVEKKKLKKFFIN